MKTWSCGHSKVKLIKTVEAKTTEAVEFIDNQNHQTVQEEELFDVITVNDTFYQCFDCGLNLDAEVLMFLGGI